VLQAPDVPSMLIELGFMSNNADIANLENVDWRNKVVSVELVDSETECVDSFGGEGLPLGSNRHTTTILVKRLIER